MNYLSELFSTTGDVISCGTALGLWLCLAAPCVMMFLFCMAVA